MNYAQDAIDFFAVMLIWLAITCLLGPLMFYCTPSIAIVQMTEWFAIPTSIIFGIAYFAGTLGAAWKFWKLLKDFFERRRRRWN